MQQATAVPKTANASFECTPCPNGSVLDVVRFLASLAIIWIHTPRSETLVPTTIVARFAVPFFVCAAVYFAATSAVRRPDRSFREYVVGRIRRIYVPFVAWSGIYIAFKLLKHVVAPDQPNEFPGAAGWFFGTAYHLWFLPFIFWTSCIAFGLSKILARRGRIVAAWVFVFAGLVVARIDCSDWSVVEGIQFSWQALPAAVWGFALAQLHSVSRTALRTGGMGILRLMSFPAFLLSQLALVVFGRHSLLENFAGIALFTAVWEHRMPLPGWSRRLIGYSFGIYLSHLLVIKLAEFALQRAGFGVSAAGDIVVFFTTAVSSIVLCAAYDAVSSWLKRKRRTHRLGSDVIMQASN